jgi:C-terminal processing protease CtpA/Prc
MRPRHLAVVVLVSHALVAQEAADGYAPGELFDAVVKAMARSYYDKEFRAQRWPDLAASYRPAALAAGDLHEERAVVDALLAQVPASHLALLSKATHTKMMDELSKREKPTFGFEVEQLAGQFFVTSVLEGGPAAEAGLRRGDRVLAIDGVTPGRCVRLDRSSDDAHLPDVPRHQILGEAGERVALRVQRDAAGRTRDLEVECAPYSAWRAAQASARVVVHDGQRIGYVHYWYIHLGGVHQHFRRLLRDEFATCSAIVLDLRGRGGDGISAGALVTAVRDAGKPVVALIDKTTRSAKEVIAYRLRQEESATLVGEHTACAVIPASFRHVGEHDVLMFPTFTLGEFTTAIELIGVTPHVHVADELRHAAGRDPILDAGVQQAARQGLSAR